MGTFNLQHPMQARNWLTLLREDPDCGFRFEKNSKTDSALLGFSFRSNSIGLHGPDATKNSNVILGTSFAMGIAVDEGCHWYEDSLAANDWLNLGLPVGIREWHKLVRIHHNGCKRKVILLYHPNIWVIEQMYAKWRKSGKGVFTALRWKRGWVQCIWLTIRRNARIRRSKRLRTYFLESKDEGWFEIDASYCNTDRNAIGDVLEAGLTELGAILKEFENVEVIRVPIKSELSVSYSREPSIVALRQRIDELWTTSVNSLSRFPQIRFHKPNIFNLSDYHQLDSHWNRIGNAKFRQWLETEAII